MLLLAVRCRGTRIATVSGTLAHATCQVHVLRKLNRDQEDMVDDSSGSALQIMGMAQTGVRVNCLTRLRTFSAAECGKL